MKYDLEDRLVDFSAMILAFSEQLPETRGSNHLASQLTRSSTASALVYGEAQSVESRRDFIHKMKIGLKELKETRINLKIVRKKKWLTDVVLLNKALSEAEELIAIFAKSISTALKNSNSSRDLH